MLLEHLLEVAPRVRRGMSRHLFRRSRDHDFAALIATIRTEIDDPIGAADHVEVVLDHQNRVPLIHKALDHIHELVHVVEAQTRGGLIDEIERLAGGTLGELHIAHFHQPVGLLGRLSTDIGIKFTAT